MHGINFLRDTNLRDDMKLHGTVAIIGGGNTAIDSARSALRIGADRVVIVYRRTVDAMPADTMEIHEAFEEGIEIMELTAPVKFIGKDNKVIGIE
jgi:NADPH-dependent glutamate synthase beta subunit-like oxidoreductase